MNDLRWYNASAPMWRPFGMFVRLWNLFNRRSTDGHFWGAGILQIGGRHLAYIGHEYADLLFVRLWTILDHDAYGMTWKCGFFPVPHPSGQRCLLYVVRHRDMWCLLAPLWRAMK